MFFSLMIVSVLQGANHLDGLSLENAIGMAVNGMKEGNFFPTIFHGDFDSNELLERIDTEFIKGIVDLNFNEKYKNKENKPIFMLVPESIVEQDKDKKIVEIQIGELKKNVWTGFFSTYEQNKLIEITHLVKDNLEVNEGLIKKLERRLVILNMRNGGSVKATNFYSNVINELLKTNKTSIVAIVGSQYNGVDTEALCINSGADPRVCNKKQSSISTIFVVIGFSLAALLGLICYLKFAH